MALVRRPGIRFVEKSQQPGSSVSFVARRYGISPSLLFSWKRRMLEGGHQAVQANEEVVGTSRVCELEWEMGRADLIGPRLDQLVPFSQPPGTGAGARKAGGQTRPLRRPAGAQSFTTKGVPLTRR